MLNFTDIRVRLIQSDGKLKAVASVMLEEEFVVHDIKIIQGQEGLFIAMPSRKTPEGKYNDIAHPTQTETRKRLQDLILQKYEETVKATE